MDSQQNNNEGVPCNQIHVPVETSRSIEWYAEGEERVVEAGGMQITIRFVGRRGRRARIAITAPPGTAFLSSDRKGTAPLSDHFI
jgi:hypothetical protein